MVDKAVRSLHVAQTFGLYDREGRTGHIAPLVSRLSAMGHEPSVVAASYMAHSPPGTFQLANADPKALGEVPVTFLPSGLRYHTLTINPGARGALDERMGGVDLVHIHGLYDLLGPAAAAVCRKQHVPYVLETMGMFRPVGGGKLRKRLFMRLLGRSMVRGAARFVASSGREAEDLVGSGLEPDRVVVRHNGLEPVHASPEGPAEFRRTHGIDPAAPIVLFLGRIAPVKNIELLLEAFDGLASSDAVLAIAGPADTGRYLARLQARAKASARHDRIRFVGPLFGQDKDDALTAATTLVLSSLNENFGIAALEAMSAGTPPVVTETCGVAEHVRDGAGLVVGLNAEEMRSAIDKLLADSALRADLGTRGKEIARRLSWEEAARLTTEMYEQVLTEAAVARPRA